MIWVKAKLNKKAVTENLIEVSLASKMETREGKIGIGILADSHP